MSSSFTKLAFVVGYLASEGYTKITGGEQTTVRVCDSLLGQRQPFN